MAADRLIPTSASTPPVTGGDFMDAVQEELTALWNASGIRLTSIGGTANALTATLAPALTGSIAAGMKFSFVAAATNTGAMTIAINGGSAIPMVTDDGAAMAAGQIVSGRMYTMESDGTNLRVLGTADILKVNNRQVFTSNGTWTKPANTPDDAIVWVYAIGGGGGGGNSAGEGGGGGGYGTGWVPFRAGDLASTVAVTIGAGGAVETSGGNTTFGSHLTAYGGGRSSNTGGGAGGGPFAKGGDNSGSTGGTVIGDGGAGGSGSGGDGGSAIYGGGGGGGGHSAGVGGDGGHSIWGGGGGAGDSTSTTNGVAGSSKHAGAGGEVSANGTIPGGGGGTAGAGARGQLTVWVVG